MGGKIAFIPLCTVSCFEKSMKKGYFSAGSGMSMSYTSGFYKNSKAEIVSYIMNGIEFYRSALLCSIQL